MVDTLTPGLKRLVLLSTTPASINARMPSVKMPVCKPRWRKWPSRANTPSGKEPMPI